MRSAADAALACPLARRCPKADSLATTTARHQAKPEQEEDAGERRARTVGTDYLDGATAVGRRREAGGGTGGATRATRATGGATRPAAGARDPGHRAAVGIGRRPADTGLAQGGRHLGRIGKSDSPPSSGRSCCCPGSRRRSCRAGRRCRRCRHPEAWSTPHTPRFAGCPALDRNRRRLEYRASCCRSRRCRCHRSRLCPRNANRSPHKGRKPPAGRKTLRRAVRSWAKPCTSRSSRRTSGRHSRGP